ncbi:hypothetical protein OPV22_000794 [Ensete ventricosum]|uniref:Nuclear transcription factor Y subunit n=1 Tax=Ensete ventricosum TaxID=4639 RepID=A0AAV8RQ36_ENSVE|nr:hypothetical protein OPV22_000794 [Ensete ventricosum]
MRCSLSLLQHIDSDYCYYSQNSSLYSTSTCVFDPTCWNSSSAITPQSSCSKNLNMNMDFLAKDGNQVKQLTHPISDHDSSTQSTGQSRQEASGTSEDNVHEQHISVNSGVDNSYKNLVDGHMKPILSLGTSETPFSLPKLDYSQSFAHVPYPCADPYFGGIFALCRPHAMIHPQMVGIASSARVPLPLQPAAEEPIYVNAKQYNAILRRRQLRAKLEAQNKLIKARKPYLHESRHLHAMKRARGSSGRFLNTKQLQQQKQTQISAIPVENISDCHQNAYVSVVIILLEMVHSGTQKATSQRRPVPGISALPAISTARFATARTVSSSSRLSYSCYEGKDERREGG